MSTTAYTFRPVTPNPALDAEGYSPTELEVIGHLAQLTADLTVGRIGFEWFTCLSQRELARVGWNDRAST